ncbi:MAG TPA: hypothetical protein VGG06_11300 [Thermoanaerobaculia bacterium]|jgi:hypothetical protein
MSREFVTLDRRDLEDMVRRMVKEELGRHLHPSALPVADDWRHEGPEDPEGDTKLLREALATLERHRDRPAAWVDWEDARTELDRAEAAGELPD